MELYESMIKNDSSSGLYKTCEYIKNNQFDNLEEEWINMTSHIGKLINASSGDTWVHINAEMYKLIESDRLSVTYALVLTAKLFLLFQKVNKLYKEDTVKTLRDLIIHNFPEGAMLSYAGLQKFSRIIPSIDDEGYPFYNRILAGLSRLLSENESDILRISLEYLTRKKNKMPMPNIWPAPNIKESKKGDPVWFLWGYLLLHFDDQKVATNFNLFAWKYQGQKVSRYGLLWGMPYLLRTNVATLWTKEELIIIEKVKGIAKSLWEEINSTDSTSTSIMNTFYPRNSLSMEPLYINEEINNIKDSIKVLKINTKM